MAKDLDNCKPKVNNVRWDENVLFADTEKVNVWYHFRIVGPVFSVGTHWIEFTAKDQSTKRFMVNCNNFSQDDEAATLDGGCPCCELGLKLSTRYYLNAIDRRVQQNAKIGSNPIRALNLPPSAINAIIALKQLNVVDGKPRSVTDPEYGCDIAIQMTSNNGKKDWTVSRGERTPLSEEEKGYECFDFDSLYVPSDNAQTRRSLIQKGYAFEDNGFVAATPKAIVKSSRVEEEAMPSDLAEEAETAVEENAAEDTGAVGLETAPVVEEEVKEPVAPEKVEAAPAPTPAPAPAPKKAVKLGAPPVNKGKTEVPDCYPDGSEGKKFLAKVQCFKCAFKKSCTEETNKLKK